MYPVGLAKVSQYDDSALFAAAADLFDACGMTIPAGSRVLVKPNLVSPKGTELATSHPLVVRAACRLALDAGAREVLVGDSPAFGTAGIVARQSGLDTALAGLPVRIIGLSKPRCISLSFGARIGVSAQALDADLILNVPKLKAHNQMRLTCAVKNLFGCVVGFRKALGHYRFGDRGEDFEQLLLDVAACLPPQLHLLDGVVAMHVKGPVGGQPCALGLLAAAANGQALDAAVGSLLGATPRDIPLWRAAQARNLPGSDLQDLDFPRLAPRDFQPSGFVLPPRLSPQTFDPFRLLTGRLKSLLTRLG